MNLVDTLCKLEGKEIVLASKSPRRIELLKTVGLTFRVFPSQVEEAPEAYEDPLEYVRLTALSKLNWVWEHSPADLVIAADTIVVKEGRIYEKPRDRDDAFAILNQLSGAAHHVITVICLRSRQEEVIDHEMTEVLFHPMEEREIRTYLRTGEADDKAGAYGIQGLGAIFIREVRGCYFNVMGFPLGRFYQRLRHLKI